MDLREYEAGLNQVRNAGGDFSTYFKSEAYRATLEPFRQALLPLKDLMDTYEDSCSAMYEEAEALVVRWEYSRGGMTLYRGYYHPCPVYDIIVGGANRGHLIKNVARIKNPPDYIYGFDADGRLITVQDATNKTKEVVTYQGGQSISFSVKKSGAEDRLVEVNIGDYADGKLMSYQQLRQSVPGFLAFDYREYDYDAAGLRQLSWYEYSASPVGEQGKHRRYEFQHDHDGYLSTYRVAWEGGRVPENQTSYQVFVKRKS